MKLKIEIRMDNAAFEPEGNIEAARILRELADNFEEGEDLLPGLSQTIRDIDGNEVGKAKVTERPRWTSRKPSPIKSVHGRST